MDVEYLNTERPRLKSWDEVMKLADALGGSVKTAYLLSARAGLRPGEALALTWGDVDLEARQITVCKQIRPGDEGPSRADAVRTVPIVEALARHLASIKPTPRADNALVCPPPRRKKKNGSLGRYRGTHLGPQSIRAALALAFKATGIEPAEFYDYGRHTFASLAALGGVPAWRLQEVLGHASIERTLRYVTLRDPPRTTSAPAEVQSAGAPAGAQPAGAEPASLGA